MRVLVADVSRSFPSQSQPGTVLRNVSFETQPSEFLTILGPSGCGKTTLLRLLAGSIEPCKGRIQFRAGVGAGAGAGGRLLVRQEDSLFPWMTALENACFGLAMQRVPRPERERRALDLFTRFGLDCPHDAFPHQLSLGMKQRVAVIRGFLSNPSLLLLDEPFAALDAQTRMTLQQELLALWERWAEVSVIFVTHDIEEAILLSDRILVFSGRPGSIVDDIPVDLPRPRDAAIAVDSEFIRIKRRILRLLGVAVPGARHAGADVTAC